MLDAYRELPNKNKSNIYPNYIELIYIFSCIFIQY